MVESNDPTLPSSVSVEDGDGDELPPRHCRCSSSHCSMVGQESRASDGNSPIFRTYEHSSETNQWERLGNAATLDIESVDFSWSNLSSLYQTKHVSSPEQSEDEMNKALEVTVNSGGLVFYALFNTLKTDDFSSKETAAVIKISSTRMATQSERLGYEFAKWLGVRTPQARVVHNSSIEWQEVKDAVENAREKAAISGDELGELTCSVLLEALELNRCLFLMNYIHGSPLLQSSDAFDTKEAAEVSASALGRVLILDLILRNEDRLPCRHLGWRGNSANLLFTVKATARIDSSIGSAQNYKPRVIGTLQKEKRSSSVNGLLGSQRPELVSLKEVRRMKFSNGHGSDEIKSSYFSIVAIDSVVPRRPPAGRRIKDQDQYPKLVELTINNWEFASSLLYEISGGRLGFPGSTEACHVTDSSSSSMSDSGMASILHEFRGGFRAALRDLQGFHIFLLTLYQKLDGLLRIFASIISKSSGECDKDDPGPADSPPHYSSCGYMDADSNDCEIHKSSSKSPPGNREGTEPASPMSRDSSNGRYSRAGGEHSRCLRLTMKLRDFNKFAKVDAELNRELEQWNEMLRADVIKLCQENNFNTGFFEGSDSNIAVDAYELKVRLEHILERIAMISDAGSTERPSRIASYLFIGGALAARSVYTLQYLGITHIMCLCSNEIGQSDSQYPEHFDYRNFAINDNDDEDISELFEEASDFIEYVEYLGGKVLVHCFEGKSRSATVVLAYLVLRKNFTLLEAWSTLKKVHRRAHPNDGFAKILLDLETGVHGKTSMEWQQKKPAMKVCPICGKNAGISSSSLKLHLQKNHPKLSSGSVDSAMTLEIQKAIEALKLSRSGSTTPK